jgi:hypothetical protein
MSEQSIIGLGFDIAKFDKEKQQIAKSLVEIYEQAKKVQDFKISLGGDGGWTELLSKVKLLEKSLKDLQDANVGYAKSVAAATEANKKNATSEAELERIKREKIKTDKEVVKQMTLEEKQEREQIKTKKEHLTYERELEKQKARTKSQAEAEIKIASQLIDERRRMNKELKDNEVLYYNVATAMGINSVEAEAQLKKTLALREVLDKLDGNLRNYQRNVGNYKSAFDGLGLSFTQIARELPSLAINANTFFLAISNNLPYVFDEVRKAKEEINALRAAGEATPGMFSRLSKSIFSFNVIMGVAIALFTAFGPEIIDFTKSLFGADNATKRLEESTRKLLEAQKELYKSFEENYKIYKNTISEPVEDLRNQLVIMEALKKSNGDILDQKKKIADAELKNNEILIKGPKALSQYNQSLNETINRLDKLNDDFSKFQLAGPGALKEGEYEKGVKRFTDQIATEKEYYDKIYAVLNDYYTKKNNLDRINSEIEIYKAEQALLRKTEFAKIEAQTVIDKNERILADERNFEDARIKALRSNAAERKRIIEADLNKVLGSPGARNQDGTLTAESEIAMKKASADRLKIEKDTQVQIFEVQEEFRKRRLSAELAILKAEQEYAAARYEQISVSEANSFVERTEAYGEYFRKSQQLLTEDYYFQKNTKILTNEELLALDADYQKKQKELADKARKEISAIYVSTQADLLSQADSLDRNRLSKEELDLFNRLKNKTKFAEQSKELERKLQRETINNAIFSDQEIVKSALTTEEEKKKAAQRIVDNQTKLNQLQLQEDKDNAAKKAAIENIYYDLTLKGVETFFELARKLSDNYHERRIEQIRRERDEMQASYAQQIEAVRNSTVSEQEKATIIAQLQAAEATRKKQLQDKENQERIRAARAQKAITIAQIISETALAVIHQLATGDPITAPARALLAGATGAAQLATALATRIPEYGDGTDNHPGGGAVIGERFQPEAVTIPGKQTFVVDKPTFFPSLAAGTKVRPLTGDEVNNAMYRSMLIGAAASMPEYERDAKLDGIRQAVLETGRQTYSILKKQKQSNISINVNGIFGAYIAKNVIE